MLDWPKRRVAGHTKRLLSLNQSHKGANLIDQGLTWCLHYAWSREGELGLSRELQLPLED